MYLFKQVGQLAVPVNAIGHANIVYIAIRDPGALRFQADGAQIWARVGHSGIVLPYMHGNQMHDALKYITNVRPLR
jgi:hypothetical protein